MLFLIFSSELFQVCSWSNLYRMLFAEMPSFWLACSPHPRAAPGPGTRAAERQSTVCRSCMALECLRAGWKKCWAVGSNDLSITTEKCIVRHLRAALAAKQRETLGELIQKQQKKFSFAPPGLEHCLSITSACLACLSHAPHPVLPKKCSERKTTLLGGGGGGGEH